jgi:hypothetical protein
MEMPCIFFYYRLELCIIRYELLLGTIEEMGKLEKSGQNIKLWHIYAIRLRHIRHSLIYGIKGYGKT